MEDEYDSDNEEEENGYAMADEYLEQYEEDGNSSLSSHPGTATQPIANPC